MRRKGREVKNTDRIVNVIEDGRLLHLASVGGWGAPHAVSVDYGGRERNGLYFHDALAGCKAGLLLVHPRASSCIIAAAVELHPSKAEPMGQVDRNVTGTGRICEKRNSAEKCRIGGALKAHCGPAAISVIEPAVGLGKTPSMSGYLKAKGLPARPKAAPIPTISERRW